MSNDQLADVKLALNLKDIDKPGPAFSLTTTAKDFLSLPVQMKTEAKNGTVVQIPGYSQDDTYTTLQNDTTPIEVIFMTGQLFQALFCVNGVPKVDQFKYCSHVRNINITGITNGGTNDTGLFSIVHSKRFGPWDVAQGTAPRSQAVHLLSLEFPNTLTKVGETDLIALVSLYRWTYLCQPPLTVNFIDSN